MANALDDLCRMAGRAIADYRMIVDGDRILLGISGGKDSLLLAHVLYVLQRRAPVRFELFCATFDPGFPDFGATEIAAYCRAQNWDHRVVSLPVADWLRESGEGKTPCVLCSRLRRGKLYALAEELGCGKLGLGQHLDDIEASFLMSLFRGQGLTTMGPNVAAKTRPVRVIRPLAYVPEQRLREAASAMELPIKGKCPYGTELAENGDRAWAGQLMESIAERIPDVRSQMLHSLQKIEAENLLDPSFLGLDG